MTEALSQFHFLRPGWLLLAPVAVVIWWQWRLRADALHGWRSQMDPDLLQALVVRGNGGRSNLAGAYWLLVAWLLGIVAIAGPTWRLEPNPFAGDGRPLMILLKADQSMERTPPAPSALGYAQLKVADLAQARKGQPTGLIAYAGSAHLVLPPTSDTKIVAKMAAEVSPEVMPEPGDRLDLAIVKAVRLLSDEGGSLLVIADSVGLAPQQVSAALVGATNGSTEKRSLPIQFLSLADGDSPEAQSIRSVAGVVQAGIQPLSADDTDVEAIVRFSEQRAARGLAGESDRWQEFGYWLTPILALVVALSFRKQATLSTEEST